MMFRRALLAGALAAAAGLASAADAPAPAPVPARQARPSKPPPAVAPDKAAKALAAVPLVNAGFESTVPGKVGSPEGWWPVQYAGPLSDTFEHDAKIRHGGERSLRVTNVGPEPFGAVSVHGGHPIELIEMRRDAVHATTDWARYEIALKVPAEAETLEVGRVPFAAEVDAKGVAK